MATTTTHTASGTTRREQPGWDTAGFTATWAPVTTVTAPDTAVRAQHVQPIRVIETRQPAATDRSIVDFGQQVSGWTRIQVSARVRPTLTHRLSHAQGYWDAASKSRHARGRDGDERLVSMSLASHIGGDLTDEFAVLAGGLGDMLGAGAPWFSTVSRW